MNEIGCSVVPIQPGTKRPLVLDWTRWANEPQSIEMLDQWATTHADAGLGLCTGKQSGVIALDVDLDLKDPVQLEMYERIKHLIAQSPIEKIGKKGFTLFFRYNGEPSRSFKINGISS